MWFEPLDEPTWLLPSPRADAPGVLFAAEPDPRDDGLTDAERDLRLGLPLYLAEATGSLANIRTAAGLAAREVGNAADDERWVVSTAVAPEGASLVRVRIADGASGELLSTIERPAASEEELGGVLSRLPDDVAQVLRDLGAAALWDGRFAPSSPALAPTLVRGHRWALRLGDPSTNVLADEPDRRARQREQTRALLRPLASAASSTTSPSPALLFFGGLVSAIRADADVVQTFRIATNARCMEATDERDPIFRISALVLRMIGDVAVARQRARRLASTEDAELRNWLDRLESVP